MSARHRIFAGAQLKVLRERRGLKQADLARQLAISPSYLSQLEHDDRPLTPRLIERVASLFPLDWQDFPGDDTEQLSLLLREGQGPLWVVNASDTAPAAPLCSTRAVIVPTTVAPAERASSVNSSSRDGSDDPGGCGWTSRARSPLRARSNIRQAGAQSSWPASPSSSWDDATWPPPGPTRTLRAGTTVEIACL